MKRQLKLISLPVVATTVLLAQLTLAGAASAAVIEPSRVVPTDVLETPHLTPAGVVEMPHLAFVGSSAGTAGRAIEPIRCLVCPTPAVTASMPAATLNVSGQHFNPGDRVEILVPGGFFGEVTLLDTVVTVASDGHCRASRECPAAAGTFQLAHDFSAEIQRGQIECGQTLDVGVTDLAPLAAGQPAMAINVQTVACGSAA